MRQQQAPSDYDPNYKWRVIAGMFTILLTLISAILIVTYAYSLSEESIVFIFGMTITIIMLVILMLFRYPSEFRAGISTSNPIYAILVAILAQVIASIVAVFVVHWLSN